MTYRRLVGSDVLIRDEVRQCCSSLINHAKIWMYLLLENQPFNQSQLLVFLSKPKDSNAYANGLSLSINLQ